jgi:hypothetical protein
MPVALTAGRSISCFARRGEALPADAAATDGGRVTGASGGVWSFESLRLLEVDDDKAFAIDASVCSG